MNLTSQTSRHRQSQGVRARSCTTKCSSNSQHAPALPIGGLAGCTRCLLGVCHDSNTLPHQTQRAQPNDDHSVMRPIPQLPAYQRSHPHPLWTQTGPHRPFHPRTDQPLQTDLRRLRLQLPGPVSSQLALLSHEIPSLRTTTRMSKTCSNKIMPTFHSLPKIARGSTRQLDGVRTSHRFGQLCFTTLQQAPAERHLQRICVA